MYRIFGYAIEGTGHFEPNMVRAKNFCTQNNLDENLIRQIFYYDSTQYRRKDELPELAAEVPPAHENKCDVDKTE